MACNLDNDSHSVPLGLGIGKVIPTEKTVFNLSPIDLDISRLRNTLMA